jgi:hypothetical protein
MGQVVTRWNPQNRLNLSLCFFNWAQRHEGVLREWRHSSTHSSTLALDGGEWLASRPGRFTPRERAPGTQWTGGWVDPRAVLDAVVKRKIPSPCRDSNPKTPIVQPVAQRYTDWAIYIMYCRKVLYLTTLLSLLFHFEVLGSRMLWSPNKAPL